MNFNNTFKIVIYVMNKLKTLLLITILSSAVYSQKVELVESIPVETDLDDPNIRNTQQVWLELIKNAKESIDIEQFYISNEKGKALVPVIEALERAADRGVIIRLIADSKFYKIYPETIDRWKNNKGFRVRIIDFEKIAGGVQHSKYFIVDGHILFLGSQNFDWRSLEHIHETGIVVKDTNFVGSYQAVFGLDWELAEGKDTKELMERYKTVRFRDPVLFEITSDGLLVLVPAFSPTGLLPMESLWDLKILRTAIDSTNNELLLQFLSYRTQSRDGTTWNEIDSALYNAANRGVKVRLLISDWSIGERSIETLKALNEHKNIEVKYTAIPEWSGGYIPFARVEHNKYIVFDNKACWISTSNMEKSYFYNSRNTGILISHEKTVDDMSRKFYRSWNSNYSHEIKTGEEYTPRFHDEKK
jgi:phosphatidylserine/phosphatidylglycerophosphate/cardiolipin synthase-like enzyme